VEGYALSASVNVSWIPGGDHSLKPNRGSGLDEASAWALAVAEADRFMRRVLAAGSEPEQVQKAAWEDRL
jgi:predicted alpha/beta-hydrolase family hydrolase